MANSRRGTFTYLAAWLAMIVSSIGDSMASAAEPEVIDAETREFNISVDGKDRGTCTMRIEHRDDGTHCLRVDSALSFNFIVYRYRYSSNGAETWRDGRLIELNSRTNFNGAEYEVKVAAAEKGLQLIVDGEESALTPDVWVTSYWHLPRRLLPIPVDGGPGVKTVAVKTVEPIKPRAVSILDAHKGRKLKAELAWIGHETLDIAEERRKCKHCRLRGDVEVDLWYDAGDRLVKQESIEEGHRTILELVKASSE